MKRWIAGIQIAVPSLFLLDIAANLLVRFPDNHGTGFAHLYRPFYWSWGAVLVIGLMFLRLDIRGLACGFAVLSMFFFSDKYNLYLEYEEWQCRGMPAWGSFDDGWRSRSVETMEALQQEQAAERGPHPAYLRTVAMSINEIEDFRMLSLGKTGREPKFHVYVSDDVPWTEVLLQPLDDIARTKEKLVPFLSAAFGVPFWTSERFAVFAPRIHDGRLEIHGCARSDWLDEVIPSELAYRPHLDYLPERAPSEVSFSFEPDSCRNRVVPLIEMRLTWRHFLELIAKVVPVDIVVDGNQVVFAERTEEIPCPRFAGE